MRGWWIGVALAIALVGACGGGGGRAQAATPMSMRAFRDAYVAEVRNDIPGATVKVTADDVIEVTDRRGKVSTAFLDNAYAHYREDPGSLGAILKRYVGEVLAAGDGPPFTADELRVMVRPASYLSLTAPDKAPLHRPLAGDLVAIVAIDQPTRYLYPPEYELRAKLQLSNEALWARALKNTARKLPGVPPDGGKKAIDALTTGEGLAASLLAEPGYWDTPALQVGGPPVVAPVGKDMVLLVHLGDPGGVAALRKIAAKSADDPDGLSTQLFVRRSGVWEVLPP